MAVWTCAVTTRALRGKQFFRCRPLVLAFHTYLTLQVATRKLCPCGTNSWLGTGFGVSVATSVAGVVLLPAPVLYVVFPLALLC